MRNFLKTFGIIAIIAIIGFSMTACPEEDDGGPVSFGDELKLSGQVYTANYDDLFPSYTKFTGDLALRSTNSQGISGSGEIKGGKLTYTVGVPPSGSLASITQLTTPLGQQGFTDISVSDTTVKAAQYGAIRVSNNSEYYEVSKEESSGKLSSTTISGTSESVVFIYVDKPVNITAKGGTVTDDDITFTVRDLNLSLKKGWNAIYNKQSMSVNIANETGTGTISISISNPDLNWVLD